jgi:hypothetical protein
MTNAASAVRRCRRTGAAHRREPWALTSLVPVITEKVTVTAAMVHVAVLMR